MKNRICSLSVANVDEMLGRLAVSRYGLLAKSVRERY